MYPLELSWQKRVCLKETPPNRGLFPGVNYPETGALAGRLLSRDRGHPSMALQALAGQGFGLVRFGLIADRLAKGCELVGWKDNHEGFKQNHGFPEAGIEVKVIRIDLFPHASGVWSDSLGKLQGGNAEIFAKILDHLAQSAHFVEELETVGKQDAIEEAADARGVAALLATEILGIERSGVRNSAVMLGMFRKSAEECGKRFGD